MEISLLCYEYSDSGVEDHEVQVAVELLRSTHKRSCGNMEERSI